MPGLQETAHEEEFSVLPQVQTHCEKDLAVSRYSR